MSIADIRQNYQKFELVEASVAADPITQFDLWFEQALASEVIEPTAMTLASATREGKPSARVVLLKGYDQHGFVFYTNYDSRKGQELTANPQASLLFFWPQLERQVRLEGIVTQVSAEESDAYFHSRPLGSRVGAWVSPQSQPTSRAQLEARMAELSTTLGADPARPPHWGGYRLVPSTIEFWQGRPSRLHDRLVFTRQAEDAWSLVRLAP
ncbi:pyridoxamine 5'-phosphate oxidase [Alcaligenaceae bacterium CGII-47]|nr:pyridoxamine 5'-phosphate oxidase [Alcaligenaceae bacterium CGII-47]